MRRIIAYLVCLLALGLVFPELGAQSSFDPDSYKSYLEANRKLSSEDLLGKNPAPYTYYSDRLHKPDLNSIPWYDSIDRVLSLTPDEEALLQKNFFMVTRRNASDSWTNSLINIYNNDLPLFLSSDYILHSLHRSYDEILLTIEWQLLESNLKELLAAMYAALPQLESKYS